MSTGIYVRTEKHGVAISKGLKEAHKKKMWGFILGEESIRKTHIYKKCIVCNESIKVKPCRYERTKFCSILCRNINNRNRKPWNYGLNNYWLVGIRNPNWRGGITKLGDKIRKSRKYKIWRESVFRRDNFTCVICNKIGGDIHAHHVLPFSLFYESRFDIENGRTLCMGCHKKTKSYLNSKIKKEDYIYV